MSTSVSSFSVHAFGQTDQGLMRSENEDSYYVSDDHQLFAVADGLGGLPEGSVASRLAVEVIGKHLRELEIGASVDFVRMFEKVNLEVFEKGRSISADMGIGTTLTVTQFQGGRLRVGHVGDTGLVVFSPDSWRQVTRDHTMAQDMLDRLRPGEHAYIPEYFSHTLTRCIGQLSTIQVDTYDDTVEPGERAILFSDGVTKTMEMDEVHEKILTATSPKEFVQEIIETANMRGGPDNVTVIAMFFE
ncbi:MAG: protein phosphatase 2C domain-containing protein [Verrucomicrobiota bacterium]